MTPGSPSIAVVGLGAIGSMALWQLAARGATVTGFDRFPAGHDSGAYGGHTRQFRLGTHDRHHRAHLPLAEHSLALWRSLEAHADDWLYRQTGQLGIGPAEDDDLQSLINNLEDSGLGYRLLDATDVMRRFPAHRLGVDEIGVLVEDAGVLASNRAVATAAARACALGAMVATDAVTAVATEDDTSATVQTAGATYRFDHVLLTTGPWAGELLPELGRYVTPRAIVSGWYRADSAPTVSPEQFPPGFRRSSTPAGGFTFLPAVDRRGAKIIHWLPVRPEVDDTASWEREVDLTLVSQARPAIAAALRGVDPDPADVAVYLEGFTPDRFPIIAGVSPSITALCGFSGMGFAVAPAMGEIAAQLALGETPDHDLTMFDPARFASATQAGCA